MCSALAGEGIGQGVLELARLRSTSKARRKLIRKRLFVAVLLMKRRVIEVYGEVEVWLHQFLIFALDGGEWLVWHVGRFSPGGRSPERIEHGAGLYPEPTWTLWRRQKCLSLAGNRTTITRPSIFWPSHYTDCGVWLQGRSWCLR